MTTSRPSKIVVLLSLLCACQFCLAEGAEKEKAETGMTKIWPACYDQPCKKSKECCDGTKCLHWMAKMDPRIKETGYCVIKGCKEGDDSTCPKDHTCLKSMMGSYCVKKTK